MHKENIYTNLFLKPFKTACGLKITNTHPVIAEMKQSNMIMNFRFQSWCEAEKQSMYEKFKPPIANFVCVCIYVCVVHMWRPGVFLFGSSALLAQKGSLTELAACHPVSSVSQEALGICLSLSPKCYGYRHAKVFVCFLWI